MLPRLKFPANLLKVDLRSAGLEQVIQLKFLLRSSSTIQNCQKTYSGKISS